MDRNERRQQFAKLAQDSGTMFVDLTVYKPAPNALKLVPESFAKRHNMLPIRKDGKILYVAMSDVDIEATTALWRLTKMRIRGVLAFPEDIADTIEHYYPAGTDA